MPDRGCRRGIKERRMSTEKRTPRSSRKRYWGTARRRLAWHADGLWRRALQECALKMVRSQQVAHPRAPASAATRDPLPPVARVACHSDRASRAWQRPQVSGRRGARARQIGAKPFEVAFEVGVLCASFKSRRLLPGHSPRACGRGERTVRPRRAVASGRWRIWRR